MQFRASQLYSLHQMTFSSMARLHLSLAVICVCFLIVSTNRYFMLQNEEHSDVSEDQSGKTPLIDSAFFKCDRQATCTHVVKFKETKKFGIILGYDQLAKIKGKVSVWRKEVESYDSCRKALELYGSKEGTYPIRRRNMEKIVTANCIKIGNKFMAVFNHDSEAKINVHGFEKAASYRRKIKYENELQNIIAYIDSSRNCRQFTRIDCYGMALDSSLGYIVDRNGNKMNYIGGGPPDGRGCRCGIDGNCTVVSEKCNCDANDNAWRFDEGYVTENDRLPITEIRLGDNGNQEENGRHTIGRVECFD
eukprot:Seg3278.1 transcript_id=Seg3278.1/GoldUCD/mRNA.D3Y31 product=Neurexin-4 protein_id=Seg3278.1/GoldUCD/D3Y31